MLLIAVAIPRQESLIDEIIGAIALFAHLAYDAVTGHLFRNSNGRLTRSSCACPATVTITVVTATPCGTCFHCASGASRESLRESWVNIDGSYSLALNTEQFHQNGDRICFYTGDVGSTDAVTVEHWTDDDEGEPPAGHICDNADTPLPDDVFTPSAAVYTKYDNTLVYGAQISAGFQSANYGTATTGAADGNFGDTISNSRTCPPNPSERCPLGFNGLDGSGGSVVITA